MGDLNSVPNPRQDRLQPQKSSIPESQLIKFLISQQFKDTYRLFFPKKSKFTFSRADSYSRIDQIWTNISVTLLDYTDIVSELQLESDHQLITLELTLQISQSPPTKQKSRKCFQWKKCNKEQLEKYANQTSQSLQQLQDQLTNITSQNQLNLLWNKIHKALSKAATKHIPYKKIKTIKEIKEHSNTKFSPLYYHFKQIQFLKNHFNHENFQSLATTYCNQYANSQFNNFSPSLFSIKLEFLEIKNALNIQQKQQIQEEIQQKIEERNQTFKNSPKIFYRNILERYNNINIDRLNTNDNTLFTEQQQV